MKASQLVKAIQAARLADRPVMLWGPPGVGKTSIVRQAAKEDKCEVMDYLLSQRESVDLRGIPSIEKGKTKWNPPAELPTSGDGYLVLEELPQAAVSTTNAATQLILGRQLGEYVLPDTWYVIATGNREHDGAATQKMPTHVANRFIHLNMEVDLEEWFKWAEGADIDPRVYAFIKYRPALLWQFDPRSKEKAFASPRSWEFLSDVIKIALDSTDDWDGQSVLELAAGIVGKEAAVEFTGFLRIMEKLVSIDSILLAPDSAPLPSDAAVTYALIYGLADRSTSKNFKKVVEYVDRLSKEYGFLFMRRIDTKHPVVKRSKVFVDWCAANAHFV